MGFLWTILAVALGFTVIYWAASWVGGAGRRRKAILGEERDEGVPYRDLGANINPSQLGNEADLWPDRTGARTRRELGAKRAADVTYVGDREEHNKHGEHTPNAGARPSAMPGVRREVQPGPHEHGPGTRPQADLAPEDQFGEDRPANRTTAPDAPPVAWHPKEHGVPGDHIREGHHRSATAPERRSDATDPYAHAPVPGPNHIIPDTGNELPPDVRP